MIKSGKIEFYCEDKGVFINRQDAWTLLKGLRGWQNDRAFMDAVKELKTLLGDVDAEGVESTVLKPWADCQIKSCPTCHKPT